MTQTMTTTPLRDAMYAMSLAQAVPDAELLDEFVRLYPEHAEALTEFAIELAVDALLHDADEPDVPAAPDTVSPVVSRVMSKFQNRLFEVRRDRSANQAAARARISVENPFAALNRDQFRALASRINVNIVLLSKLRDRQVDPVTIPQKFCRLVAEEMDSPLEVLTAHLYAPHPTAPARQFYKSDGKPDVQARQTFEEAVNGSGMSPEQQRLLLSFRD
jgi:hypothetical protein